MFETQLKSISEEPTGTEQRLLEAAGEIFAEFGYRAATVRQICEKAGANVAAVNYHFRDKEGLYLAVLRSVPDAQAEKYPAQSGLSRDATPEQQLRGYVQTLLQRVFDAGRPGWHAKLLARELAEPTRALDTLLEDVARPLHQELRGIVRRLLGSGATDEDREVGRAQRDGPVRLLSVRPDRVEASLSGTRLCCRRYRRPSRPHHGIFLGGDARICP